MKATSLAKPALICAAVLGSTLAHARSSSAPPSAELARQCRDMAIDAHPRAVAGSTTGTAHAQRKLFRKCVKARGNVQL
jgi:hypothetical protein